MISPSSCVRASLGVSLLLATGSVHANWQPQPEPQHWSLLRQTHLSGDDWVFMEATDSPGLQAAEYIRSPRSVDGTVELEAGLLLRRGDQTAWVSKVIPMRAICAEGRLEQRDPRGNWAAYPGRPGTVVKVRWICSMP